MTTQDLSLAAAENLHRTYFALGMATPGSKLIHEAGFDACIGNFDHPICNFASRIKVDPWVAHRLLELALSQGAFNIYSLAGDLPEDIHLRDELLVRAGFRKSYGLRQLAAEPGPVGEGVPMEKAESMEQRRDIATFMASLFFGRHSSNFRRRVAEATMAATELDLYSIRPRDETIAAVMVAEDEQIVGLFNLCVKTHAQGRGWGKAIVAEVMRKAFEKNKPVTLQCDELLSPWYESLGFRRIGSVDVYALPDERRVAIMN